MQLLYKIHSQRENIKGCGNQCVKSMYAFKKQRPKSFPFSSSNASQSSGNTSMGLRALPLATHRNLAAAGALPDMVKTARATTQLCSVGHAIRSASTIVWRAVPQQTVPNVNTNNNILPYEPLQPTCAPSFSSVCPSFPRSAVSATLASLFNKVNMKTVQVRPS